MSLSISAWSRPWSCWFSAPSCLVAASVRALRLGRREEKSTSGATAARAAAGVWKEDGNFASQYPHRESLGKFKNYLNGNRRGDTSGLSVVGGGEAGVVVLRGSHGHRCQSGDGEDVGELKGLKLDWF